jgi:hypothetical protein
MRLSQALCEAETRRFAYGSHDCCVLAADAIRAMTGRDVLSEFASYKGLAAMKRIMQAHGGVEGIASSALGPPLETVRTAKRGDIVSVHSVGRKGPDVSLGVVVGQHAAVAAPVGLAYVPMSKWLNAWAVD